MNMKEFDDAIFEEDEFGDLSSKPLNEEDQEDNKPEDSPNKQDGDLTTEILRLKGISDTEKIKFEDETGAIVERDWNSLSREEQLNILLDAKEDNNTFNEDELQLINAIRESGMSVEDYLNSIQPEVEPNIEQFNVDSFTDEEMYAMDLLEKIGPENISDEEITQAIEVAKQNETLFKKTVEGLRKEYVRMQQNKQEQYAQEQAAKQEEAYNKFAASIQNQIKGLDSFAGRALELSKEDIEELSDFILNLDESGMSAFGRAMNDPALFTKAAFWILNEDKIKDELSKQIQYSYKRGYEAAKKDMNPQSTGTSKLVINNTPTNKKQVEDDELFLDDWE